jgi:hypothetical protein
MFSVKYLRKLSKILDPNYPEISESLSRIKTPISPIELSKILGLDQIPKVIPYEEENLIIEEVYIPNLRNVFKLSIENEKWMVYSIQNLEALFEVYSHYDLAKGHCICTGLGFGIREKWLLSKKEVTKVTVIEKNIEVINYHKKINPDLINQIEIVHCDASQYEGQCDTLLLDHYELLPFSNLDDYFLNIKQCSNNIRHDTLWFWPLEYIISSKSRRKKKREYNLLRTQFPTLPDIDKKQLNFYYNLFYLYANLY